MYTFPLFIPPLLISLSNASSPLPVNPPFAHVRKITQGLAAEFGQYNIRVNSVCPLRAATGLLELFSGKPDAPEERERFAKTVPLGRMSTVEDVANAFLYLASDEASFVTGLNMQVDGGRLAV